MVIPRQQYVHEFFTLVRKNDIGLSDLDLGTLAFTARQEAVFDIGEAERSLEATLLSGLNWAIISQAHAFSDGHVDTAGVYTAILVLTGIKYWAIRKTSLPRDDMDCTDTEYFVNLAERDLESLPGGAAAWTAVLLFPGDIL